MPLKKLNDLHSQKRNPPKLHLGNGNSLWGLFGRLGCEVHLTTTFYSVPTGGLLARLPQTGTTGAIEVIPRPKVDVKACRVFPPLAGVKRTRVGDDDCGRADP